MCVTKRETMWIHGYMWKLRDNRDFMLVKIRDKVDIHMYVGNERQRGYVYMGTPKKKKDKVDTYIC